MQNRRMRVLDSKPPFARFRTFRLSPKSAPLPLLVYRDFLDMLYSMWVPIAGLGLAFVAVCILIGVDLGNDWLLGLAVVGALTTFLRLAVLRSYKLKPPANLAAMQGWERRYAIGNYISAALLALLNIIVISYHDPLLHLISVSLVFGFGAGVVARISIRPRICVISLLLATVPTVVALAAHALTAHPSLLHAELFAIEALIVAMITGLSLQTVAHLFRSAVEHHTARHDMTLLARNDALTGLANRLALREQFQARMDDALRMKSRLAVHFLDLDGFKPINDRYGHPAGDALLVEVARRTRSHGSRRRYRRPPGWRRVRCRADRPSRRQRSRNARAPDYPADRQTIRNGRDGHDGFGERRNRDRTGDGSGTGRASPLRRRRTVPCQVRRAGSRTFLRRCGQICG